MKVIVIGGGIIGITTAWKLQKQGCSVTIIEKDDNLGNDLDINDSGRLAYGTLRPFMPPSIGKLLKFAYLSTMQKPYQLDMRKLWRMHINTQETHYSKNLDQMLILSEYSKVSMDDFRKSSIEFSVGNQGALQLLSDFMSNKTIIDMQCLKQSGIVPDLLSRKECFEIENRISSNMDFTTGIYFPQDCVGNSFQFINGLTREFINRGGQILFNNKVERLLLENGRVIGTLDNKNNDIPNGFADYIVVCCGNDSERLLKSHGIELDSVLLKSDFLNLTVPDNKNIPISTVIIENNNLSITQLENSIRVSKTFYHPDFKMSSKDRIEELRKICKEAFPDVGNWDSSIGSSKTFFTRTNSLPIISKTHINGLFINTHHGEFGWTLACGGAALICNLIMNGKAEIDSSPYSIYH